MGNKKLWAVSFKIMSSTTSKYFKKWSDYHRNPKFTSKTSYKIWDSPLFKSHVDQLAACRHAHIQHLLKPYLKKRKDSLEGSMVWLLSAAEIEFSKILVPTLHQMQTLKVPENQNNCIIFFETWYIVIFLFWY